MKSLALFDEVEREGKTKEEKERDERTRSLSKVSKPLSSL
jgi:hypothetical protein